MQHNEFQMRWSRALPLRICVQGVERGIQQGRVEGRVERESLEDVLMQWFRRALLAQRTAGLVDDPA